MANNLKPNPIHAIEFLHWLNSEEPLHLEFIASENGYDPKGGADV